MLHHFFTELRSARIPVTTREYLTLLEALDKGVIEPEIGHFYSVSRAALVKDEKDFDKFEPEGGDVVLYFVDVVFSHSFVLRFPLLFRTHQIDWLISYWLLPQLHFIDSKIVPFHLLVLFIILIIFIPI